MKKLKYSCFKHVYTDIFEYLVLLLPKWQRLFEKHIEHAVFEGIIVMRPGRYFSGDGG